MQADPAGLPPREFVLRMLGGKWLSAAIAAFAELGIPEALADRPRSVSALATDLSCNASSLSRLLSVMRSAGFVEADDNGALSLTEAGACLLDDDLGPLARLLGRDFNWEPWAGLAQGVRSGKSVFEAHHGCGLFDYLDAHDDAAATYQNGIEAFVRGEAASVAEAFDFSSAHRVVDLGGGQGELLQHVLERWPHLEGVLVERRLAAEHAARRFERAGLAERASVQVGDLLELLPGGFDVYVLKHVIHCLDDDQAQSVLAACASKLANGGAVLVIEGLRLPADHLDQTGLLDLEMLVLFGSARERSKPEMRRLFAAAGLRLVRAPALPSGARLLVAEKARSVEVSAEAHRGRV